MNKLRTSVKLVLLSFLAFALTQQKYAYGNDSVASVAKEITVKIYGAVSGSGVIVSKYGDTYQVLTAWHVVKSNNKSEEIDIYTSDGKRHLSSGEKISRISDVDLGLITFKSDKSYKIAKLPSRSIPTAGNRLFVAGYPLPSPAVPKRIWRFVGGELIANASGSELPNGYELLYSNQTYPGMSGGPVLSIDGELIGIHGQAETDVSLTQQSGIAVKTGTNQGIPISKWPDAKKTIQKATDELGQQLASAKSMLDRRGPLTGGNGIPFFNWNGFERDVISLMDKAITQDPGNKYAYNLRGIAKKREPTKAGVKYSRQEYSYQALREYIDSPGRSQEEKLAIQMGALNDFQAAILIDPNFSEAHINLADVYQTLYTQTKSKGFNTLASQSLSSAIALGSNVGPIYFTRAGIKKQMGDVRGYCLDLLDAVMSRHHYSAARLMNDDAYETCRGYFAENPLWEQRDNVLDQINKSIGMALSGYSKYANSDGHLSRDFYVNNHGSFGDAKDSYSLFIQNSFLKGFIYLIDGDMDNACSNIATAYYPWKKNSLIIMGGFGKPWWHKDVCGLIE